MTRWFQVSAGRGPAECRLFVERLAPILLEEASAAGCRAHLVGRETGPDGSGWSSALLALDGDDDALDRLAATWVGTMQWTCASPVRPGHRRKNWYVGVRAFGVPERQPWSDRDVRFETSRAGGPGGQHVNKTETAVRVIHEPTGVEASAREERSQAANRKLATARLAEALAAREREATARSRDARWRQHDEVERGRAVRVYRGPELRRVE